MLIVVIILNFLISLFCLYVSWRVWKLRRVLRQTADVLTAAERCIYAVLHVAPQTISQGQVGVQGLRERYQQLQLQLQMVRKTLTVLSLVQSLYRSTQGSKTRQRQRSARNYSSVSFRTKRSHSNSSSFSPEKTRQK